MVTLHIVSFKKIIKNFGNKMMYVSSLVLVLFSFLELEEHINNKNDVFYFNMKILSKGKE